MNAIRLTAACLLLVSGVLHVVAFAVGPVKDTGMIITVIFGVIYLALGGLLFRGRRLIVWLTAILSLIGLMLATAGMFLQPTWLGGIYMVIDVAVAACCFGLLFRKTPQMARA